MGTMIPFASLRVVVLVLAGTALPASAQDGQTVTPAPAPSPTEVVASHNPVADRLAAEMRVLAQDPRDVRALLNAADLSATLNDNSASLAFLQRAEGLDPSNPRIAAQRGAVLVKLERPGEAMLLFRQAEQAGLPMQDYLADRALAFDLLGNPTDAQADYQRALAMDREDETVRRYALSLGISGRVDESMAELDPLLRRSDRAAWRARAFILAMNGDVPGAERIASSMMGNMAGGLSPFFRRLQSMSATDRAHAVHFGSLSRTPARIADAQLAPMGRPAAVAARPSAPSAVLPATPNVARPAASTASTNLPAPPAYQDVRTAQLEPLPPSVPVRRSRQRTPAQVIASANQPAPPGPARVGAEDNILAAIVSGIAIPESELELMDGSGDEEATGTEIVQPLPAQPVVTPPAPIRTAAVTAKPEAKKPEPKKKPEPAKPKPEPARIWVQVAGGANEKTLATSWNALVKKAPAAFKGKSAWTTPLRATNRVLAGPFKSNGEAQTFVNVLKKEKISAFVFTSEVGQKITKLEVK